MLRMKDDVVLTSTEHVVIESDASTGQYTLTIVAATADDAGQYTVVASNQFGKSQCTATLLVQGSLSYHIHILSRSCHCNV